MMGFNILQSLLHARHPLLAALQPSRRVRAPSAVPGGGIDEGEDWEVAARRELYEETGIKSVTLIEQAPDWITYDLPEHLIGIGLKGKFRGQKQRWFAYRFEGEESEIVINPPPDGHTAEFDAWKWADMADLPEMVVEFKKGVYREVVSAFSHLTGSGS